jgi:hypothetical protein
MNAAILRIFLALPENGGKLKITPHLLRNRDMKCTTFFAAVMAMVVLGLVSHTFAAVSSIHPILAADPVTPEPATLGLLAVGGIALLLRRRR